MPMYEVSWRELRYVNCSAEVEAETKEEAIKKAQEYQEDVYEAPADTFEVYPGTAKVLEE